MGLPVEVVKWSGGEDRDTVHGVEPLAVQPVLQSETVNSPCSLSISASCCGKIFQQKSKEQNQKRKEKKNTRPGTVEPESGLQQRLRV